MAGTKQRSNRHGSRGRLSRPDLSLPKGSSVDFTGCVQKLKRETLPKPSFAENLSSVQGCSPAELPATCP